MITVVSTKGGCGKTTFATNLAAVLADGGAADVCVLDLDLAFGDVALALHLPAVRTLADAIPTPAPDRTPVRSLLSAHSPGLSALVAPPQPEVAETISADLVHQVLTDLRTQVDYVVIDTPPALDDHVIEAIAQSDLVILLATPAAASMQQLHLTIATLDLLGHSRDRLRLVINRADGISDLSRHQLQAAPPVPVSAFLPASRDVPASIENGQPLVLTAPDHPVSRAVAAFADQFVD